VADPGSSAGWPPARGRLAPNGRPVRGARVWHISFRASSASRRIFTSMGKRVPAALTRSSPTRLSPPRDSTSSGYLQRSRNLFLMGSTYDRGMSSLA